MTLLPVATATVVLEAFVVGRLADGALPPPPHPLTNAEMMRLFRESVGAPFGLPAMEWMLEIGAFFLRTETELILKSRRVIPGKLTAGGFEFRFPKMREALRDLLAARSNAEP